MTIREEMEDLEERLSPLAQRSRASRGRLVPEPPCKVRTDFQRDRDRIVHSKAFRRLKHKTQVFIAPEGDHFRTRLTHTLEVAQVSRTVARALGLNEDLAEAIALGHDLGHTPFGHAGEEALNEVHPGGFRHNRQSLRVVEKLEQGEGLNLTWEVRDGILCHTGSQDPLTLEGQIVKICDRIAYVNHDIDDALRAGVIKTEELPEGCLSVLGYRHRDRINTMVLDLIEASKGEQKIKMGSPVLEATNKLRQFLFEYVYIGSLAKKEEGKAKHLIRQLYRYYAENPDQLPEFPLAEDISTGVCDYIAGMTDRFAISRYAQIFVPVGFQLSSN